VTPGHLYLSICAASDHVLHACTLFWDFVQNMKQNWILCII